MQDVKGSWHFELLHTSTQDINHIRREMKIFRLSETTRKIHHHFKLWAYHKDKKMERNGYWNKIAVRVFGNESIK